MDIGKTIEDVKAEVSDKPWLLLIPVGVVGFIFIKSKSNQTTDTGTSSALTTGSSGSLSQATPSVGIGPDMLANAIQSITTKQNQNVSDLNTEITGNQQQNAINIAQVQQAVTESSQQYNEQLSHLENSVNAKLNKSLQDMSMTNTALAARNKIGDNNIVSYFANFKLPSWIGLQYVAEEKSLPTSIPELEAWLNSHGYRNVSTGQFTSLISGPVPTNVQQELTNAYAH